MRVAPSAAIRGRPTTVAAAEAVVGRRATGDALALLRPGGAECRAIHRHVDIRVVRIQVERAPPETATRDVDRAVDRGRTQHVDRRYAATLAVPAGRHDARASVHRQRRVLRHADDLRASPGGVAVAEAHLVDGHGAAGHAAHGHELETPGAVQAGDGAVGGVVGRRDRRPLHLDHQQEVVGQEGRRVERAAAGHGPERQGRGAGGGVRGEPRVRVHDGIGGGGGEGPVLAGLAGRPGGRRSCDDGQTQSYGLQRDGVQPCHGCPIEQIHTHLDGEYARVVPPRKGLILLAPSRASTTVWRGSGQPRLDRVASGENVLTHLPSQS